MDSLYNFFKALLEPLGFGGIILFILVIHVYIAVTKPENFKIIYGAIFHLFAFPFKGIRKKAIRYQIEGPCSKALRKFSSEFPDLDVPDLKVSWVNEENLKTKLLEGKAIIKLKFDNDNTRNIVKATTIYVKDAFLIHAKNYISPSFRNALDFSVTKKILLQIADKNKAQLITHFIDENSSHEPDVFEKCERIEEIDDNGLFTRILLRELNSFGNNLLGRTQKTEYANEAEEFLKFIRNIATRDFDDDTPLTFPKTNINIGVVLVAKSETYHNYGVAPYLRRIKLGLTQGIKTFYLLARSEKVEILKSVANDLIQSGDFYLVNQAKEYKDYKGREAICYCLEVNQDSLLANAMKSIGECINTKTPIQVIITKVKDNSLVVDYGGVEGFINRQNLSILDIPDAKMYFNENNGIEALPIEIKSNGIVEFTLKNTAGDPNYLISTKFTLNNTITGEVKYCDDNFIKFDLGHEKIEGIAYRKDLTPSRFEFLHKLFPVGRVVDLKIIGYNYERAHVILRLVDLKEKWPIRHLRKGSSVKLHVCKKTEKSLVGEIEEGVEAVLPYWELGFLESQIHEAKKSIKLNDTVDCVVKEINNDDKIILLSKRELLENPYETFLESNTDKVFDFIVSEENAYGVLGSLCFEPPFDIYIPKYEMSWNGEKIKYQMGSKYKVSIKSIDKKFSRLIGSFKPILPHPLKQFEEKFTEGQVLKNLSQIKLFEHVITYNIKLGSKDYEGILLKGEVSNKCFVTSCLNFASLNPIPLVIKKIDSEKNRIILSLADLTKKNNDRIDDIDYTSELKGIVLGEKNGNYIVIINGIWVEGILETKRKYKIGEVIEVRPALVNSDNLILTDE